MKQLWIILVLGSILLTSCYQEPQASNDKPKLNSSVRGKNSQTATNTPRPPTPKPTKTSLPTVRGCVVNATALFIRSGLGKNFSSVGNYNGGDCMIIKGRNSETTWVSTDKGWVSAYYIDAQGDLTKLPVIFASTTSSSNGTTAKPKTPTPNPPPTRASKPTPTRTAAPKPTRSNCDPSYPGVCIPPPPPDLDCRQINYCQFFVCCSLIHMALMGTEMDGVVRFVPKESPDDGPIASVRTAKGD